MERAAGARTVCRGSGRSLSQSSGKSAEGSKMGLHWAGAGGLCRSHVGLGTLEVSLPSASPARSWPCLVPSIVPDACRYGTTGLMWGFPTWVCGSNRVWSISLGRHLSRTDPPPPHSGSLQGSLPHAEGSITDQISWGGKELLARKWTIWEGTASCGSWLGGGILS